ncbi:TPD1 protein homolog 1A-like [Magnolia sinica]|uniref:TPD1 protein homolog 1A-like n=1 Tax=Magnolia sinica TaxID=86752 RepID=UPI0026585566|nr:TPD1 protein homolog 1A-like [Magnolia sinica]
MVPSDTELLKHAGWAAPCSISNIVVTQVKTGASVEGKPEYEVTIANNCICSQSNVIVRCAGFSSVEKVDPTLLKPLDGVLCLINNGNGVFQSSPIKFKYAWMTPFDLSPASSQINCS